MLILNKNKQTRCRCGALDEYVKDSLLPFVCEGRHNEINLVLSDTTKVPLSFCFFCGGNEAGPCAERIVECQCGSLPRWAEDANFPIEYNSEFDEYNVVVSEIALSFYYCPVCGGHLPKSKRDEILFLEPSPEEVAALHERTVEVETLSELIKTLGKPDEVFGELKVESRLKEIYGQRDIKQAVRYDALAKTVFLLAQEYDDGGLQISIVRKPKSGTQSL